MKNVILIVSSLLLFVGCGGKKAQVQSKGDVQAQSSYVEIGAPTEVYIEKPSSSYTYIEDNYSNGNYQDVIYEDNVIYENTYTEDGRPVYDTGFYDEYEEKIKSKNKKKKIKRPTKRVKKKSIKKAKKKRKTHTNPRVVKPVEKEETIFIEKKKSRSTILN